MKIELSSKFSKGLVDKLVASIVRKKLGCNPDISIEELNVTTKENGVRISINASIDISNADVTKLLKDVL